MLVDDAIIVSEYRDGRTVGRHGAARRLSAGGEADVGRPVTAATLTRVPPLLYPLQDRRRFMSTAR